MWLDRVLSAVANKYGLRYEAYARGDPSPGTEVLVDHHSLINRSRLPPCRGSHLIRDPRDIVVSGYNYHLWTDEEWARVARPEYGNRSYQEYLNSLTQEDGLLAEMRRFATAPKGLRRMVDWDYSDPSFTEVRYEDLVADEAHVFRRMFEHYGFSDGAVEEAIGIAEAFSFKRQTGRSVGEVRPNAHLRSGRAGQWRDVFGDAHLELGRELYGEALIKLGYETDRSW
jgi:Sulfotransferase domain